MKYRSEGRNLFVMYRMFVIYERQKKSKQNPWPESATELYPLSDLHLSANLVPSFADRGVLRSQRGGSPTAVIKVF
jgi:hypothetical protein